MAELRNAPSSPRSVMQDFAQWAGIEGKRSNDVIDRLIGGSEKNPLGALDFTPVGIPLSANRAGNELRRGNYGNAALEALGALPVGIGKVAKTTISPLLKSLQKQEAKQITSTVPDSPGKSFQTYQFTGGNSPSFGVADRYDDSIMNVLTGHKHGNKDFNVLASSVKAPGDDARIRAAVNNEAMTVKQGRDAIGAPEFTGPFQQSLIDALAERDLTIGNTLKSGGFNSNKKGIMDAAMSVAQSKDIRDMTGFIKGSRVSGAKSGTGNSLQQIDIPALRARGEKRNIAPPTDLSLYDNIDGPTQSLTKDDLLPAYDGRTGRYDRDDGTPFEIEPDFDEYRPSGPEENWTPEPRSPEAGNIFNSDDVITYFNETDPNRLTQIIESPDDLGMLAEEMNRSPRHDHTMIDDMLTSFDSLQQQNIANGAAGRPLTLIRILQNMDDSIPF